MHPGSAKPSSSPLLLDGRAASSLSPSASSVRLREPARQEYDVGECRDWDAQSAVYSRAQRSAGGTQDKDSSLGQRLTQHLMQHDPHEYDSIALTAKQALATFEEPASPACIRKLGVYGAECRLIVRARVKVTGQKQGQDMVQTRVGLTSGHVQSKNHGKRSGSGRQRMQPCHSSVLTPTNTVSGRACCNCSAPDGCPSGAASLMASSSSSSLEDDSGRSRSASSPWLDPSSTVCACPRFHLTYVDCRWPIPN